MQKIECFILIINSDIKRFKKRLIIIKITPFQFPVDTVIFLYLL